MSFLVAVLFWGTITNQVFLHANSNSRRQKYLSRWAENTIDQCWKSEPVSLDCDLHYMASSNRCTLTPMLALWCPNAVKQLRCIWKKVKNNTENSSMKPALKSCSEQPSGICFRCMLTDFRKRTRQHLSVYFGASHQNFVAFLNFSSPRILHRMMQPSTPSSYQSPTCQTAS